MTIAIEADPADPEDFDVTADALAHAKAERRKRMSRPPTGGTLRALQANNGTKIQD